MLQTAENVHPISVLLWVHNFSSLTKQRQFTQFFRYGLSYSNFTRKGFRASTTRGGTAFTSSDTITFSVDVQNTAGPAGSDVVQVAIVVSLKYFDTG